ncbi:BQ2448_279 [Microbotryum intermedium]|uniref:BQ2448_279 protein n=1 Tax=Microbotryum intermedium TaxID=269621 RepID=A0A238FAK7_9BASI|nr:BQ2448_279 [Microbotryum intermedium]
MTLITLYTKVSLGKHVRLTQRFVEGLTGRKAIKPWQEGEDVKGVLKAPMRQTRPGEDYFGFEELSMQIREGASLDCNLEVVVVPVSGQEEEEEGEEDLPEPQGRKNRPGVVADDEEAE